MFSNKKRYFFNFRFFSVFYGALLLLVIYFGNGGSLLIKGTLSMLIIVNTFIVSCCPVAIISDKYLFLPQDTLKFIEIGIKYFFRRNYLSEFKKIELSNIQEIEKYSNYRWLLHFYNSDETVDIKFSQNSIRDINLMWNGISNKSEFELHLERNIKNLKPKSN